MLYVQMFRAMAFRRFICSITTDACIRKPWSYFFMLYNNNTIAHNYHTHIYIYVFVHLYISTSTITMIQYRYSPTQMECGGENFYCPSASAAPTAVSSGYFSAGGNSTTRQEQVFCDIGAYWGSPPAARVRTNVCPSTVVP